ncbi:MAG: TonB-dependent receptor [Pseudomonadota bacterium]
MRSFYSASSTLVLVLAMNNSALAQNASSSQDSFQDVIVVTSQFREQNVLEVPLSVTTYNNEQLQALGINEFDELSNFVPGFVVQEQSVNNPGFVLRGITSDDGASNIEPRVSIFQNGVSIARPRGSIVQLFDLERVEVLKGPQGTLFGRSAQIGAVHVITQKPTYELEGFLDTEFGNFDQQKYTGAINLPLIDDKLALRTAATYEKRSGFIENNLGGDALNGTESFALRGSLRWDVYEDLRFDLIGHFGQDTPPGTSFKSGVIPALGGTTDPNDFASLNTFGGFLNNSELGVDRDYFDVTGIFNWTLSDSWSVTSTTGYREFDSVEVFDPDGSALPVFVFAEEAEASQISSDIRFSYDDGDKLQGFFGGGVFFEKGSQNVPLGINTETALPLNFVFGVDEAVTAAFLTGNPAAFPQTVSFQLEQFTNFADNFSFDLFGELSYEVLPNLILTVGGRYTRDDKETLFSSEIIQSALGGIGALVTDAFPVPVSSDDNPNVENNFDGFAWRAVLNYEFQPGRYVYFNYSRGRRPEVLNEVTDAVDGNGNAFVDFEVLPAEIVNSYELGFKGSYFDRRLTVESAVYYYDYVNFQTDITELVNGTPMVMALNAGSADSVGVEMGLTGRITDGLNLFLTYGFNRGRFNEEDSDGNPQIFGGNQFRLSPDHALSVTARYEQPTRWGDAFFTPSYTYRSEVFFEEDNVDTSVVTVGSTSFTVPGENQPAYGLVNIRAGLRMFDGAVTVEGYVENLLDKEYIIDAGNTGGGFGIPTFIGGPPRFYGGGVTFRF